MTTYQFKLINTTPTNIIPYIKEPEFEKVIDGRNISNVTLNYDVVLPPSSGYDGATINFSGSALNALCTAFQMEGNDIFRQILPYSSSQQNGTIMNYAAKADGSLQKVAKTTNGDFGHWFNASGTAITFGSGCVVYAEFTKSSKSVVVGQYPYANSNGTQRTIREALHYKDNNGSAATACLVFNITFLTGVTAYSHLSSIDYAIPNSISPVSMSAGETSGTYDLKGRKVNEGNMLSGIYIVGGKKRLVK